MLKNCWNKFEKMMKKDWKFAVISRKVRVRSATTSNWMCPHMCVRTLIWTCKVGACDPKNSRNSHFGKLVDKTQMGNSCEHAARDISSILPPDPSEPYTLDHINMRHPVCMLILHDMVKFCTWTMSFFVMTVKGSYSEEHLWTEK